MPLYPSHFVFSISGGGERTQESRVYQAIAGRARDPTRPAVTITTSTITTNTPTTDSLHHHRRRHFCTLPRTYKDHSDEAVPDEPHKSRVGSIPAGARAGDRGSPNAIATAPRAGGRDDRAHAAGSHCHGPGCGWSVRRGQTAFVCGTAAVYPPSTLADGQRQCA